MYREQVENEAMLIAQAHRRLFERVVARFRRAAAWFGVND